MKCQEKNKHYATFEIFHRKLYVNIFPSCRPKPPVISPIIPATPQKFLNLDNS
jgi:hypothetical protein